MNLKKVHQILRDEVYFFVSRKNISVFNNVVLRIGYALHFVTEK